MPSPGGISVFKKPLCSVSVPLNAVRKIWQVIRYKGNMPQKWVVPEIRTFLDFQKNGVSDKNVFLKELFTISPQQKC
jgi:hypothetical protein